MGQEIDANEVTSLGRIQIKFLAMSLFSLLISSSIHPEFYKHSHMLIPQILIPHTITLHLIPIQTTRFGQHLDNLMLNDAEPNLLRNSNFFKPNGVELRPPKLS